MRLFSKICISGILAVVVCLPAAEAVAAKKKTRLSGWTQSYKSGYKDVNGAWAGGSEIMHLVAHKKKLYAANGYWMDTRWMHPRHAKKQSTQVLRLDSTDGQWLVDLDTGKTNDQNLRYMKSNILKSVTFTRDAAGKKLRKPVNLLIAASGTYKGGEGMVSVWVRDDNKGKWSHKIVQRGSRWGGTRWIPRDMQVYQDRVTGQERIFLLIGDPGIISGVYDDSLPGKIRWDAKPEYPKKGKFNARPLGIVQANGCLMFSAGGAIYKRIDGKEPVYKEVIRFGEDADTDVGGVRGLTAIDNPKGKGKSLIFMWAQNPKNTGQLKRLDPDGSGGYTVHDEVNTRELMKRVMGHNIGFTLGAYNMFYPFIHPDTGKKVHIFGFQGCVRGPRDLMWEGNRYYGGAVFAVRSADGKYVANEVNGKYAKGRQVLVAPRTFVLSPFGDNVMFVGGHDANSHRSDNMAWIYKAPLDVIVGGK